MKREVLTIKDKKGELILSKKYIEKHRQIHKIIREKSPTAHKSAKRLFRFKYPKLAIFIICILAAYLIFRSSLVFEWVSSLKAEGYLWSLIFGALFSFGFTTPFSIGFFITAQPENIFLAAVIGGFGAFLSDMIIFKIIRFSFMDEFELLERSKIIQKINRIIKQSFGVRITHYVLFAVAGIVIASPLPDELGVTMLAGLSSVKPKLIGLLSFIFNTIGIFVMLLIAS